MLVIAVIGEPGGMGMRDIFPVIFPVNGNLEQIFFPVNGEFRDELTSFRILIDGGGTESP